MEKKTRIKVAIFTIFAIFLMIGAYMWFTEFRLGLKRYYYEVVVEDASWLERGDIVTLSGVNKGRVEKIDIEKDKVVIKFFLDGIKLREGAKIFVENQGFLGRKRVMVKQGKGDELPSGTRVYGSTIPDLGDLVREGGELIDTIKKILHKVNKIAGNMEGGVQEVKNNIVLLSSDLKKTSESLREIIERGGEIEGVVKNLNEITARLKKISDYLENEEGSLGKIIKDKTLYNKIDSTLTSLNLLLKDINKNPKKYFKFSIF
ncbi:MAG: MlaD family protein [candidate division WOR-3 bacterium]